jgi:hypothetical protein
MVPAAAAAAPPLVPDYITVHLDGRTVGAIESRRAARLVMHLRRVKAARLAADHGLPLSAERPSLQARSASLNLKGYTLNLPFA